LFTQTYRNFSIKVAEQTKFILLKKRAARDSLRGSHQEEQRQRM